MLQPQNIPDYFIKTYINEGDIAIDATAGNGNDTLKLALSVGKGGRVFAFDIQKEALENTKKLLEENNICNTELICDSHSEMDKYVKEKVKGVVFNLGYLPGGDHSLHTQKDTTINAIKKALELICQNGFVAVSIYHGKNSGTEERDGVMEYLKNLDHKKYTVLICDFFNRPNNPPITAIISKN